MRIEVIGSGAEAQILVDDVLQKDATIKIQETIRIPFGLVYLNGQRVHNADVWMDGVLRFTIPPWSELVDLAYDAAESGDWIRIDSIVDNLDSPKMELIRGIARLSEKIQKSPERGALLLWESWMRVIAVFRENARELAVIVDDIEGSEGPPDREFAFLPYLDRALINYVVSFKFVLDHLKWINDRLPDRPELGAIPSRRGRLEKVDVVAFAIILRNHLTHGSVVDPSQHLEFAEGGARLTLNLIPRVLLDEETSKNPYSRSAKRYIEKHLERLSIKKFASELNKNTLEFCEGILENIESWHAPEISQIDDWRKELSVMQRDLTSMTQYDSVSDVEPLAYDLNLR